MDWAWCYDSLLNEHQCNGSVACADPSSHVGKWINGVFWSTIPPGHHSDDEGNKRHQDVAYSALEILLEGLIYSYSSDDSKR